MTRAQPEFNLQCAVVQHLKLRQRPDVFYFAVPNGERRSIRAGAKLKAMGMRAGVADMIIVAAGRPHALELKAGKGRLSPAQREAAEEWEAAGGSFHVASTIDDALSILTGIGAIFPEPRSMSREEIALELTRLGQEQDPIASRKAREA